jgi:hypothetical protein
LVGLVLYRTRVLAISGAVHLGVSPVNRFAWRVAR